MVAPHQVLSQENAGVEAAPHLWVYLFCVVHELFEFLGECDHALGESRQQSFDQVEVFVVLASSNCDILPFEVVERHLEVDLLELVHEALGFTLFVFVHQMKLLIYNTPYHH